VVVEAWLEVIKVVVKRWRRRKKRIVVGGVILEQFLVLIGGDEPMELTNWPPKNGRWK
jgi:hypothetical protein